MTNFIEEFYYGNIDPQVRSSEQNKKVQHDMQILTDNEDFLTDKFSGEEKKRLTVDDLLHAFTLSTAEEFANDRILLS